jgi:hypothetical protein
VTGDDSANDATARQRVGRRREKSDPEARRPAVSEKHIGLFGGKESP